MANGAVHTGLRQTQPPSTPCINKKDTNTARKPFLLTADMKKGDNTYKMYEPQNLADYIKWCFKQVPDAKVFVLAFGDHGAAYSITTDYDKSKAAAQAPTRRGMLYDDNIEDEPCMTPAEMATAINAAGKKIDLVFFDCYFRSNRIFFRSNQIFFRSNLYFLTNSLGVSPVMRLKRRVK